MSMSSQQTLESILNEADDDSGASSPSSSAFSFMDGGNAAPPSDPFSGLLGSSFAALPSATPSLPQLSSVSSDPFFPSVTAASTRQPPLQQPLQQQPQQQVPSAGVRKPRADDGDAGLQKKNGAGGRQKEAADPFSDLLSLAAASGPSSAASTASSLASFTASPARPSSPPSSLPPSAAPLSASLPASLASLPSVPHHLSGPVLSLHTAADESTAGSLSPASSPLSPLSPVAQQLPAKASAAAPPPSAAAAAVGGGSKRSGRAVAVMSAAELAAISNPLARAEAVEQQKTLVGNYRMVAPLAAKREAMRLQPVQNILRLQPMAGIRAELERARGQLGEVTCSAIAQRYIAMGTARGVVLVFNHFEQLQMALGRAGEEGRHRGAVTCLDFSPSGELLVVGYQRGVCAVWDTNSKKEVKDIKDASTRPITHVRFTKRGRAAFLAVDDMVRASGRDRLTAASQLLLLPPAHACCAPRHHCAAACRESSLSSPSTKCPSCQLSFSTARRRTL